MRSIGAALILLAWLSGVALASPSRQAWEAVWKSDTSTRHVSISGVAHTRTVDDEGERTAQARVSVQDGKMRLDYEAGKLRWSVIDDGGRLIRLSPEKKRALVLPRPSLVVDKGLAERNYEAVVAGQANVAGRPVQIVEIRSQKAPGTGQVAWRLWLDRETGFALKRERYNAEGKLTSGTEYVEVKFGASVDSSLFAIPRGWQVMDSDGGGERLTPAEMGRRLGFTVLLPGYTPPGYELTGGYIRKHGRREWEAAELRYTDGLRVLSVFQREREEDREAGPGAHHRRGRGGPPGTEPQGGGGRGDSDREGHGRGGRGREGAGRGGFGPPGAEEMSLVDRGSEKALRYLGAGRVVVVIGDLPAEELMRVARSLER